MEHNMPDCLHGSFQGRVPPLKSLVLVRFRDEEVQKFMESELKKAYLTMLVPAAVLCFTVEGLRELRLAGIDGLQLPEIMHRVVFVASALTAVAAPLFARVVFVHGVSGQARVGQEAFHVFHRRLVRIAMITPYFAFLALLFGFSKFYSGGILLMSFYAAYYYYPSRRRIEYDRRLFRVS